MFDVIPRSVKAYQDKYPGVAVALQDMSSSEQVTALHQGRIAAGFAAGRVKDRKLSIETIVSEPVTLALPANHELTSYPVVPLKALAFEQVLMCPRHHNPSMYDQLLGMFHRAGIAPQIIHQPAEMQLVLGFVASGLGVAIVPATLQKWRRGDFVFGRFVPPVQRQN